MPWLRHATRPQLRQRLLPRDLGILAPTPVWTRNLRLVVPLDQVPLEELLIAVAAAPARVEVIESKHRFPAVLPYPAAQERPGVPDMSRRHERSERSTSAAHTGQVGRQHDGNKKAPFPGPL